MSKFLFHLFNHSEVGKRSLEDVLRIVIVQMRACGHDAFWDPDNEPPKTSEIMFAHGPDEWNVVVEGFTDGIIDVIRRAHDGLGARFLCLATEEPTEKGFNHGTQIEMVHRQEKFGEAMRYFDGILHLVPGRRVTEWYSRFAPTAQVELGFAPALMRPNPDAKPGYDFGFYGSLTPRRHALLKRLQRATNSRIRIVMDFADDAARTRAMQDAKVLVQIRKFDEMGLVSSSRCNTALCLGRPVIAEAHDEELSHPWDQIVRFCRNEDDFFYQCRAALRNWQGLHHEQFIRFATTLTPRVCIGDPIRSLGLSVKRMAA